MAIVTKLGISNAVTHSAPFGNAWKKRFVVATDASGALVDAGQTSPLQAGDVIRVGWLPAGIELHDALAVVSGAFADGTAKVGFAYADGVDSGSVPQDDDYFFAALPLNAAARKSADNASVKPERLPKAAYLTVQVSAAQTGAGRLDLIVEGINQGNP